MTQIKCEWCGTPTTNKRFCSRACSGNFGGSLTPIKDKNRVCKNCKQSFIYKALDQQFCSRSCSAKYHNPSRVTNRTVHKCPVCNITLESTDKVKKKFCSKECTATYKKNQTIENWVKDPSSATTSQGLSYRIRQYLLELANYQCSLCGWGEINPVTQKTPLEVDHIDGNCSNNHPSNLVVLCPNCHSLTSTYKALNKNSSRRR